MAAEDSAGVVLVVVAEAPALAGLEAGASAAAAPVEAGSKFVEGVRSSGPEEKRTV